MKKPSPKPDPIKGKESLAAQYEDLGAHFIAQEIAITCLFEAISKSQPANAQAIVQSMREALSNLPKGEQPKARAKVEQWIAMMEGLLAHKPQ